jgi:predicted PhzF superfamily epimerase YddE/YHI9
MSSARARERSGHATMATAHTLFTQHHPSATSITFQSRFSGTLIARRAGTGPNEPIALDFPAAPLVTLEEGHRRRPKILEGVAKAVKGFEESQVVRVAWWDGHKAPIVELAAGTDLENLQITPAPLVRLEKRSFERLPLRNPH